MWFYTLLPLLELLSPTTLAQQSLAVSPLQISHQFDCSRVVNSLEQPSLTQPELPHTLGNHMKTLLLALTLVTCSLSTQAQSITNVTLRFTINGANTTLNIDSSAKKDAARLAGLTFAYGSYTNAQGTNSPLVFDAWLKNNYLDLIESYRVQKQQNDNAARIAALTLILSTKADALVNSDYTALDAIIAKIP